MPSRRFRLTERFFKGEPSAEKIGRLRRYVLGNSKLVITLGGTAGAGKSTALVNLSRWLDLPVHELSYRSMTGPLEQYIQKASEDRRAVDILIDSTGVFRAHEFAAGRGGIISGRVAHALDNERVLELLNKVRAGVAGREELGAPPLHCKILMNAGEEIAGERNYWREEALKKQGAHKEEFKSVEDAVNKLRQRNEVDRDHFRRLYGIDIHDPASFDAVVNTSALTQHQTLVAVINAIRARRLELARQSRRRRS